MKSRRPLNETPEWKRLRRILAEQTDLDQRALRELGECEADSMDFVELVMGLEEKYEIKIDL
ncbi:MAG: phosphopantetheine-binding protein [Candidatus Acidiferrales bacterium]